SNSTPPSPPPIGTCTPIRRAAPPRAPSPPPIRAPTPTLPSDPGHRARSIPLPLVPFDPASPTTARVDNRVGGYVDSLPTSTFHPYAGVSKCHRQSCSWSSEQSRRSPG